MNSMPSRVLVRLILERTELKFKMNSDCGKLVESDPGPGEIIILTCFPHDYAKDGPVRVTSDEIDYDGVCESLRSILSCIIRSSIDKELWCASPLEIVQNEDSSIIDLDDTSIRYDESVIPSVFYKMSKISDIYVVKSQFEGHMPGSHVFVTEPHSPLSEWANRLCKGHFFSIREICQDPQFAMKGSLIDIFPYGTEVKGHICLRVSEEGVEKLPISLLDPIISPTHTVYLSDVEYREWEFGDLEIELR